MVGNDFENWERLKSDKQSAMNKEMAEFIQQRFDFVASSLHNNICFDLTPTVDPADILKVDGYDGIIFKEKGTDHYLLANRDTEAGIDSWDNFLSRRAY